MTAYALDMISFKMILMGKSQQDNTDYVTFLKAIPLLSTQDMFAFWCKAEREKSPLCQQHVRTAKLGALQKQARARHGPRTPHAVRAMQGSWWPH